MLYLKSCTRCKAGDVELISDLYGKFFRCLQCGWALDLPDVLERRHSWPPKRRRTIAIKRRGHPLAPGTRVAWRDLFPGKEIEVVWGGLKCAAQKI